MAAVLLTAVVTVVTQVSVASADPVPVAAGYAFHEMPIAYPAGYDAIPKKTIRDVNPAYFKIRSWISAVGGAIAINDFTGHGRADGLCFVDTRTDKVVVTYTPTAVPADRFAPFLLDPAPQLPMDSTMAPMGCVPGDYNGDGRQDFMVYYWGRTPVLFLAKSDATTVARASYQAVDLVPQTSNDGKYHGPRWNTNAVNVDDYDGDGHPDIYVGNYFPDSDVLDPNGLNNVQMPTSLSNAHNGGGAHVLRWNAATTGTAPTASYVEAQNAVPFDQATGWTLALGSADLTADGLPEVYVGNDFGRGHLLYNISTRGNIKFANTLGERGPTTPKSFQLGKGSFKGMGIDFGDLDGTGKLDMTISAITTAWGLEESNFVFMNKSKDAADMKAQLSQGVAPYEQEAEARGMAWTGWCWDVKMADFRNSGTPDVVQTDGFVQGNTNRWAWLQELAMNNDMQLVDPANWPNFQPGDDLSGREQLAFYAHADGTKWTNVATRVGLAADTPTRGVAMGDTTGTGKLDLAVARQWGPPAFYRNDAPNPGGYLNLQLFRPTTDGQPDQGLEQVGTPAYAATVTITDSTGRKQASRLDGGSGHSGKRSFEVHFGLGNASGPVSALIQWRDNAGTLHDQTVQLTPGTHALVLAGDVKEASAR